MSGCSEWLKYVGVSKVSYCSRRILLYQRGRIGFRCFSFFNESLCEIAGFLSLFISLPWSPCCFCFLFRNIYRFFSVCGAYVFSSKCPSKSYFSLVVHISNESPFRATRIRHTMHHAMLQGAAMRCLTGRLRSSILEFVFKAVNCLVKTSRSFGHILETEHKSVYIAVALDMGDNAHTL